MGQEADLRVCDMKPQELFNVAWAFAQVPTPARPSRHCTAPALACMRSRCPLACSARPMRRAECTWGPHSLPFSATPPPLQLGHHPHRLFESIAREAGPRAFEFSTQELGNTLWALAKCRHAGPALPPLLRVSVRWRCWLPPGSPAKQCSSAWL